MNRKSVPLSIKASDDATGTFTGLASVFDNLDYHGDIVRRGAFTKSLASGQAIPLLWEHKADDPRNYVGDITAAVETNDGLQVTGKFDLSSEHGAAAYRNVKGRRVSGLSIGYAIRNATKTAAGNELTDLELIEVSVVARGANDRALIGSVKSAGQTTISVRSELATAAVERYRKEHTMTKLENTPRVEMLTKDRARQLELVNAIVDAAKEVGKELNAEDAAVVEAAMEKCRNIDAALAQIKTDQAVMASAKSFAEGVGGSGPAYDPATGKPVSTVTIGSGTKHLALSGKHGKALAHKIIAALPDDKERGTKAIVGAGQLITATELLDTVEAGRPALSLLDVIGARVVGPSYRFLRQTQRDLSAITSPTAVGSLKPAAQLGLTTVEDVLRVMAAVSDPIDEYALKDLTNLQIFVQDELVYAVRLLIEAQIVTGSGTAPNCRGILNTSGIVVQAFATDIITSIRKALTTLEVSGYDTDGTFIYLSPSDWEAIELLTSSTAAVGAFRGVPVDPVERRLFGKRVVVATGAILPAKTGLVVGGGSVELGTDGLVDVQFAYVGDGFSRNQVVARAETRANVLVGQPGAIVKVGTAA
ncbi:HK97 family phage prohead protease [Mycobacteroides abscessus subsp. abscessus]|uniref:HK97 family phage prohead protease n=1 Tax=Mycobacteroides abscessus TaxID=36809 RepID=UPI0009A81D08|nr:HK97 family phage prohead protease [Mycobacteroides abscessus]SKD91907.1 HK97 family phage prohead protease [Mycobacteroides abscessus subsp. abscessus]